VSIQPHGLDVQTRPRHSAVRARRIRRAATPVHTRRRAHWRAMARRRVRRRVPGARRLQRALRASASRWDEPLDYPRLAAPSVMAFFKRKEKVPTEVERLDWKLLERGAVALYYKGSVLSQDLAWLRHHRYVIHELDAVAWKEPV